MGNNALLLVFTFIIAVVGTYFLVPEFQKAKIKRQGYVDVGDGAIVVFKDVSSTQQKEGFLQKLFRPQVKHTNLESVEASPNLRCRPPRPRVGHNLLLIRTYAGARPAPVQLMGGAGHLTKMVDVVLTDTSKPIFLALHAYDPVLWNFTLAKGVEISGVAVFGYHAQALANLPEGTKVSISTYDTNANTTKGKNCPRLNWSARFAHSELEFEDAFAKLLKRDPDSAFFQPQFPLLVGPDIGLKPQGIDGTNVVSVVPVRVGTRALRELMLAEMVQDGSLITVNRKDMQHLYSYFRSVLSRDELTPLLRALDLEFVRPKGYVLHRDALLPNTHIGATGEAILMTRDHRGSVRNSPNRVVELPIKFEDLWPAMQREPPQ